MKKKSKRILIKNVRLCYRSQRRFCSEKGEDISTVKNRKKGDSRVLKESVKKKYIQSPKLPQISLVFLMLKKNGKKRIV